jgi:peptidoglycan/LPS O-acetylase OafA/YrhL
LWVVIAHCCLWGGFTRYYPKPKVAVDIFMMVSGYLMMYTAELIHINEPLDKEKNWLKFYLRRFFRLSPGYYTELIIAMLLASHYVSAYQGLGKLNNSPWLARLSADFSFKNILFHITYLFGLLPKYAFSTMLPDWSLSLEMQFYLLFPFIFLFFKKSPNSIKMILVFLSTVLISYLTNVFIMKYYTEASLILYQLPMFLIGVFIFYSANAPTKTSKIVSAVISILYCIYSVIVKEHYDNMYLLAAALLLLLACTNTKMAFCINRIMSNRLVDFMSNLSYSVYLFHGFFISLLGLLIESRLYPLGYSANKCVVIIVFCVVPSTYLCAYLSYKYIELPGIKFGKNVISHLNGSKKWFNKILN